MSDRAGSYSPSETVFFSCLLWPRRSVARPCRSAGSIPESWGEPPIRAVVLIRQCGESGTLRGDVLAFWPSEPGCCAVSGEVKVAPPTASGIRSRAVRSRSAVGFAAIADGGDRDGVLVLRPEGGIGGWFLGLGVDSLLLKIQRVAQIRNAAKRTPHAFHS